jgi:Tol biopolymer transport system component
MEVLMTRLLMLTSFVFGLCLSLLSGWNLLYRESDASIGWLIFTSPNGKFGADIYRIGFDGSLLRNLSNHVGNDDLAKVIPDRKWLLFISDRSGKKEIYRMRLDGSEVSNLTNKTLDNIFTWTLSHSGEWALINANDDIYRMKADGSGMQNLTQTTASEYLIYPSRIDTILGYYFYLSTNTFYQIQADGSVTDTKVRYTGEHNFSPQFTDDGKWAINHVLVTDLWDYDIYRINLENFVPENLTANLEGSHVSATLTTSGQWIVFLSHDGYQGSIYRMRVDGSELKPITPKFGLGRQFMLSPDDKWIFFVATDAQGNCDIYRVGFDGANVKRLTYDHVSYIDTVISLPIYPTHREIMLAVGMCLILGNIGMHMAKTIKTVHKIKQIAER